MNNVSAIEATSGRLRGLGILLTLVVAGCGGGSSGGSETGSNPPGSGNPPPANAMTIGVSYEVEPGDRLVNKGTVGARILVTHELGDVPRTVVLQAGSADLVPRN